MNRPDRSSAGRFATPRNRTRWGVIFDFDGVIADSEIIANQVLARLVTEAGLPTRLEDSLRRYCGRRWSDAARRIETDLGGPLPPGFQERLLKETLTAFSADLTQIAGARGFIRRFAHAQRCIASSSAMPRLEHCLALLGLERLFHGRVVSADMVQRGKPAPDIFLLAARQLGVAPRRCIVIEDSPAGVRAGCAAGMTVIGFCGGGHARAGHAARLRAAGACHVVANWREAGQLTARLMARQAQAPAALDHTTTVSLRAARVMAV